MKLICPKKKKQEQDKARTTWFCIGYSTIWQYPISKRLKRLRDKYKLSWLQNAMSFHKFTNLGEKLNADLSRKVMIDVYDYNFRDRKCNCDKRYLKGNKCWFGGKCRRAMVVYENKCLVTGKLYIGKTQLYQKKRTGQHISDVWKVIETGRSKYGENWTGSGGYKKADSFAKHFAQQCRECTSHHQVRAKMKKIMEPKILWQGDRILCMKSSRTLRCKICMTERKEILKRFEKTKNQVINDNSDIFSSCKCGSRFHKFARILDTETTLRMRPTQKSQLQKESLISKEKR